MSTPRDYRDAVHASLEYIGGEDREYLGSEISEATGFSFRSVSWALQDLSTVGALHDWYSAIREGTAHMHRSARSRDWREMIDREATCKSCGKEFTPSVRDIFVSYTPNVPLLQRSVIRVGNGSIILRGKQESETS